jgi:serine/threonine protein kinase
VQHAHQKCIIHRDMKKSNVMLTLHDGTPVVKVIDFGIAKAQGHGGCRYLILLPRTVWLSIYPKYLSRAVQNNPHIYNYAEWNKRSRVEAAKHVNSDTREQPKPREEVDPDKIQIICPPAGLILFSGAHLHETAPNTSGIARYSIDFRTIHYGDACRGMSRSMWKM